MMRPCNPLTDCGYWLETRILKEDMERAFQMVSIENEMDRIEKELRKNGESDIQRNRTR
jgi:hypothetical protein